MSIYNRRQLDWALATFPVELVQLPLNLFDHRWLETVEELAGRGVEVHARSAFLQGLLLMHPDDLPPSRAAALAPLRRLRGDLEAAGVRPLAAALAFALSRRGVGRVVIGVAAARQLDEIVAAAREAAAVASRLDLDRYRVDDPDVIDPSRW